MKGIPSLIGASESLLEVRELIEKFSLTRDPVLITGETGVGKELVARAIHQAGIRKNGPFVAVNMSALAEGTLESELFGHERGAFTGAIERRIGRFEQANGGTLLLDEIGDAPLRVQAELLRVVEQQGFERLGGIRPIRVDARVLAATNRDLLARVENGTFREDLWYRLSALRIHVPPLHERIEDIPAIVRHELNKISAELERRNARIKNEAISLLQGQPWPGNVRELRLAVRRMVILSSSTEVFGSEHVLEALRWSRNTWAGEKGLARAVPTLASAQSPSYEEFQERERIEVLDALNSQRWNVSAAARSLGVSRGSLRARMRRLGVQRIDAASEEASREDLAESP